MIGEVLRSRAGRLPIDGAEAELGAARGDQRRGAGPPGIAPLDSA